MNDNVLFFPNGNTAFFRNGHQVPELQKSWLRLYVDFLERQGVDPTTVKFEFPNKLVAEVFKVEDGYNWRF